MPDGDKPDGSKTLTMSLHAAIKDIDRADWDACAGDGNPFVSHAFLSVVEDSGSANARTGWIPQHAVLRNEDGAVVAVAPIYAKSHSLTRQKSRQETQLRMTVRIYVPGSRVYKNMFL